MKRLKPFAYHLIKCSLLHQCHSWIVEPHQRSKRVGSVRVGPPRRPPWLQKFADLPDTLPLLLSEEQPGSSACAKRIRETQSQVRSRVFVFFSFIGFDSSDSFLSSFDPSSLCFIDMSFVFFSCSFLFHSGSVLSFSFIVLHLGEAG